jgi:hypothetical protein
VNSTRRVPKLSSWILTPYSNATPEVQKEIIPDAAAEPPTAVP